MVRAALLIGAPALKDHPYLNGVDSDILGMKQFLQTPNGGSWRSSEIHELKNPTKATVRAMLNKLGGSAEYLMTLFGGHGHIPSGSVTHLCINDDEEISIDEIFPATKRQTLIVDTCRHVSPIIKLSKAELAVLEARSEDYQYAATCRILFDKAISSAEEGRIVLHSCSPNQSANDGLFTPGLIRTAESWVEDFERSSVARSTFSIYSAYLGADRLTRGQNPLQHPVFSAGRRNVYFPFAVA